MPADLLSLFGCWCRQRGSATADKLPSEVISFDQRTPRRTIVVVVVVAAAAAAVVVVVFLDRVEDY